MSTLLEDAPTSTGGITLFLGRQPILDRRQELFAFELLFRSGTRNAAVFDDDAKATAAVITNTFHELGVESVLGRYRGFINVSESLLMSDMIEMLPRESVVLEVLESVRTSPQVAARCAWLRKMGYALALDDVASADEALEPLLPSVEYVKVDMKQIAPEALPGVARHFKVRGVHLLAEKVDTREQVERCLEFGFDFFQGYYFARPEIISGRRLSPSEATLLDLLGLILTDAEQAAIEEALKRDVALSVNLLRLANSAASGLRRGVVSLGSAIMLLGRRRLRRWLQLLLYASEPARNVPTPLMQLAATRGRMMELLAPHALGHGAQDLAFLAGIMSLLDTLLKRPLAEIIALLPVPAELRSALLDRGGRLGAMLVLCEAVEDGDPACVVQAITGLPGLSAGAVTLAHADALRWANSIGEQAA